MLTILLKDIVPIFVIMALGFIGAKRNAFSPEMTQGFNKLVLNIALPAALFVSITKATRAMLEQDLMLTAASFIGVVGMFLLCALIAHLVFKRNLQESAIAALIAGSPTIGFLGFAVFDPIWGATTTVGLVVAIIAIEVNAITIPIGFYMINKGMGQQGKKNSSLHAIVSSLKAPVVWSPLLAVIMVLVGIRWPASLDPSFDLIAKANSGVAVFAAGLALASIKFGFSWEILWNTFFRMVLSPLVVCIIGILLGVKGDVLTMLTLGCALPPAFSGIIISSRYNVYLKEGASSLAVSTLAFALTAPFWIWAVPQIEKLFA